MAVKPCKSPSVVAFMLCDSGIDVVLGVGFNF